jgi:hypothetical protein
MCPGRSWIPGRKTAGPRQCIFVTTVGPSVCVARTAIDTPDVLCMAARFLSPPTFVAFAVYVHPALRRVRSERRGCPKKTDRWLLWYVLATSG